MKGRIPFYKLKNGVIFQIDVPGDRFIKLDREIDEFNARNVVTHEPVKILKFNMVKPWRP